MKNKENINLKKNLIIFSSTCTGMRSLVWSEITYLDFSTFSKLGIFILLYTPL